MTYINTSLRWIDTKVKANKICRILGIPTVGAHIYETKMWPQMEGFILGEAVKRLCGLENDLNMSKPSTTRSTKSSTQRSGDLYRGIYHRFNFNGTSTAFRAYYHSSHNCM